MTRANFIAQQLGNPSGIVGRLILPFVWNRRNSALNDVALKNLALTSRDRVLEVGFGGGYLLGQMSQVVSDGFIAGIDISPAMVSFCTRRYRRSIQDGKLELKCARAESLPFASAQFDKICTVNSIFYWQDAPQAFSEFARVMVAGGRFVTCFTCRRSIESKNFANHITLYSTSDVQQMMDSAGFHHLEMVHASDQHREFVCMIGFK
jgi:ubiquinone/menaquinone biosynthesis C-methylase UbiE